MRIRSSARSQIITLGVLLGLIFVLAAGLRFYNLNWDSGAHLHYDERYLTMAAAAIRFPGETEAPSSTYWDTQRSPLNPGNHEGFADYAYGTLPIILVRAAALATDELCTAGVGQLCSDPPHASYDGLVILGRAISATADLLTLAGLALLAGRLYGQRASILAALLYGLAVLPIQQAHFFVVDHFTVLFAVWALALATESMTRRSALLLMAAGASVGLAIATTTAAWPLAGVVALGASLERGPGTGTRLQIGIRIKPQQVLSLIVTGIAAALAYRIAQPYAFKGPGFLGVELNTQWIASVQGARAVMNGTRDVPYVHQWAGRLPVVFSLSNMVLWGLGLPLGLAAWAGWAVMGWQMLKRRELEHSVVWLWGTVYFLYQSTQWAKSMRYMLPVYPVFVLFAAWLLARRSAGTSKGRGRRIWSYLTLALTAGAWIWVTAFLAIYLKPTTRVSASEWMFDNLPTAVTLRTATGKELHIPIQPGTRLTLDEPGVAAQLTPEEDVSIVGLTLNRIAASPEDRSVIQVVLTDSSSSEALGWGTAEVIGSPANTTTRAEIALAGTVQLEQGRRATLLLTLTSGSPLTLQSSVIANEHWDDGLPLRLGGRDPFGNWYSGLSSRSGSEIAAFDPDTPEKRLVLLDSLDEADYIVLSSNRLYASIPRLPQRYPLTIAYYEALFGGSLGFRPLAEFTSFPTVVGCDLPDQETPFTVPQAETSNSRSCQLKLPAAEEAFSVYDHPRVLIFGKTDAYSREIAEQLLPESLLANVEWVTARTVSAAERRARSVTRLVLDTRTQIAQRLGGTWSRLFGSQALVNRSEIAAALAWWLAIQILGWLAYPLVFRAFPALSDRGYSLSKIVGLLLWSYAAWLLSSLGLLPHTRGLLWAVLAAGTLLCGLGVWLQRRTFIPYLARRGRFLLRTDLIFTGLFVIWVIVRALNPDLWHPVVGGEKPMDFAYLNAVVKSTWYPPYDPWFAGGTMNYYYFGFVMVGSLTKALGIMPSVAYNLAIAGWYALTGIGAYTCASSLVHHAPRRAHVAGLLGICCCLILGNLGELRLLYKGFQAVGDIDFDSLIPGYPETVSALAGVWKVLVEGRSLSFRPEWWYWDATRVIPYAEGEVGPINEFPAFTFLYGDLHAHMLAFPLTQAALGLALQWASVRWWGWGGRDRRQHSAGLVQRLALLAALSALVAGALRATNTWDYPTYTGLMILGLLMGWGASGKLATLGGDQLDPHRRVWRAIAGLGVVIAVVGGAEILFRPFALNYVTAYTSVERWTGSHTPLGIYLIMYGQFLLPLVIVAGAFVWRKIRLAEIPDRLALDSGRSLWLVSLALLGVLATVLGGAWLPLAWVAIPLGIYAAYRVLDVQAQSRDRTLWLWVGSALLLSLLVEVVVLKGDISRMNTVFKFHLQVWMLLAITGGVALERVFHELFAAPQDAEAPASVSPAQGWRQTLYDGIALALAGLLFAASLYPALAIPAKVQDRWAPQAPAGLDGMTFMQYAVQYEHGAQLRLDSDYRAITWLQQNVKGSPVVMEAQGEREYLWGNRISVYTGLPSVVGWRWHQVQQRLLMPGGTVEERQRDVRDFYNTTVPEQALEILERYEVEYVVLAPYERAYMVPEGLAKFVQMESYGWLERVYQDADTAIYHVLRGTQ